MLNNVYYFFYRLDEGKLNYIKIPSDVNYIKYDEVIKWNFIFTLKFMFFKY